LPNKITTSLNTTDKIEYLYDATGTKLAKMIGGTNNLYEYYMGDVVLKKTVPTDAFSVGYLLMPKGRLKALPNCTKDKTKLPPLPFPVQITNRN